MTLNEKLKQLERGLQKNVENERQAQADFAQACENKRDAKSRLKQAREARLHQEGAILALAQLAQDEQAQAAERKG